MRRRCSSCRRVVRRRRARSCPRSSPSSSRVGPTTASTSGPGCDARDPRRPPSRSLAPCRQARRASRRSPIACARTSSARSSGEPRANAGRSSPASCSATTRPSRRRCATGSARRGSTTCWPCPGRTSRSSPSACSFSPRLLGVPRLIAEVCALAGIAAYVLAVGAQPSVVRAGIVGALGSLAWLAARQRDRWHFLLLAAFVLLAWNPYTLLDAGFELSFAAVAAIFVLVRPLMRILEGYPLTRGSARRSPCRRRAASPRLRCCGSSSTRCRSSPCPANALAAPAMAPLLGLALSRGAARSRLARRRPRVLAALAGWCAAWLALCAR